MYIIAEFTIIRNMSMAKSRVRTLTVRRVDLRLFKELLDGIPWKTVLRDVGSEQSWQFFQDAFLRAHSILQHKKSSTGGRKQAWLSIDHLREKKMYRQ